MTPSLRLTELLAEPDEPPVDPATLPLEQRAVLHAYWRAGSVRFLGQTPTMKSVEDNCQEDVGYGLVARRVVAGIVRQLLEQGWKIELKEERTSRQPKQRGARLPKLAKPLPLESLRPKRSTKLRRKSSDVLLEQLQTLANAALAKKDKW